MKNIVIEKSENGTYIVKADTERFGAQAVMFESFDRSECARYIIRTAIKMYTITKEEFYLSVLLAWMDEKKQKQYDENRGRNAHFTGHYGFSMTYIYTTEEGGLYIKCTGCRSGFSVFFNPDGTVAKSAPAIKSMTKLGFSYNF